jgi:hypothetical protein
MFFFSGWEQAAGTARSSIGSTLISAMEDGKTPDSSYAQGVLQDTLALFFRMCFFRVTFE